MATKKFVITGLGSAATAESIQVLLDGFGPIVAVKIICNGNSAAPVALVEMIVGQVQSLRLTSRISNYWHDGKIVNAWLLQH